MEKRVIIALLLCGLVLVIHMVFITPLLRPKPVPGAPVSTPVTPSVPADNGTVTPGSPNVPPTPTPVTPAPTPVPGQPAAFKSAPDQDNLTVQSFPLNSPLLVSTWSNEFTGGCLDVTFTGFYTTVKQQEKLKLLGVFDPVLVEGGKPKPVPIMVLEFPELQDALANMKMHATQAPDGSLVFRGVILQRDPATGRHEPFLEVTKTVRAPSDRYEIQMDVTLRNLTAASVTTKCIIRALEGIHVQEEWRTEGKAYIGHLSDKGYPVLQTQAVSKFKGAWPEAKEATGKVIWAGLDDRYFAALLFAENRATMEAATLEPVKVLLVPGGQPVDSVRVKVATAPVTLAPGAAETRKFHLFVGPKRSDVLDQYDRLGLPRLVDFGWFGPIAVFLVWVLRGFYAVVRNYGVAIILLTAVTRVALHPLTRKGQVAMYRMQKLQPKIKELQQKHKNDKQKLGTEQMKLFREHGVSPFSGCLPMLLQMPILFALFYALRQTFEMRQSPFCGWITDLSLPDTVGHFPAGLPFLGGVAINILPLLMTVAMFFQQRMTPKSDDPQQQQQQKMMAFMPLLFAFMFYSMPSGLCLYWFTSTVLGMAEQYLIKRHLVKLGALAVPVKVRK
jgi:YidC/Oxa1 family membrane protein insertase